MSNLTLKKSDSTEVISAEQGKLIDRAKVYLKADEAAERQGLMYKFLIGATLLTLKDCTPHGQFEEVKKIHFPESSRRTVAYAMQFAEAAQFFAKGKCATIAHLVSGDRLLTAGELSEKEKSALIEDIEKVDKGGMVRTIQEHLKKKTKPKPETEEQVEAAAQHAHDEREKNIAAVWSNAEAALKHLLHLKDVDFVLAPPAQRLALSALCVRVNKRITEVRPTKKS